MYRVFKKIIKAGAMGLLLNNTYFNYLTKAASRIVYFDYKEFVVKNLRGFKPQKNFQQKLFYFLSKFNKKPSVALLMFLYYRLSRFDKSQFDKTNEKLQVRQELNLN